MGMNADKDEKETGFGLLSVAAEGTQVDWSNGCCEEEAYIDDGAVYPMLDDVFESDKTYSGVAIKEAFWKAFNESGELWFPYGGDRRENNKATEYYWKDFYEALSGLDRKSSSSDTPE